MARKTKPVFKRVEITGIGTGGKAIARINDLVTFVSNALPGDVADIRVHKKRSSYQEGSAVRIHEHSDLRTDPFCRHFGVCGGCRWQDLQYESQLKFKQQEVYDALQRIGGLKEPPVLPIVPADETRFYRNKLEFAFSNRRWLDASEIRNQDAPGSVAQEASGTAKQETPETAKQETPKTAKQEVLKASGQDAAVARNGLGLHVRGMFDKIVDLQECHLQPEPSNSIRLAVREYAREHDLGFFDQRRHTGLLRNLVIRTTSTGETMVIVSFGEDREEEREGLLGQVRKQFPELTSLMYLVNDKGNDSIYDREIILHSGRNHLVEELEGLRFRIGPKSFFQTNTRQALKLYGVVKEHAGLTGSETVYDLYTGTGAIACFLAGGASKVIGIESIEEAVEDARVNAGLNKIENCKFFAGDIMEVMDEAFVAEHGKPDVLVADPPRAGMHKKVVQAILDAAPSKIVYVSCNPATQARDIQLLGEKYRVISARPVDMFPHTYHVENVCLLEC